MNKKQIAIFHPSMVVGGAEKVLINMLKFFDYEHFDVDLFILSQKGALSDQIDSRVHVTYIDVNDKKTILKKLLKKGKILRFFTALFLLCIGKIAFLFGFNMMGAECFCYYLPVLSNKKYDVAINYQGLDIRACYLITNRIDAKKHFIWFHGSGCDKIPKQIYQKMDRIFCVSKGVQDILLQAHPELKDKAEIFYNLIDTKEIITKSEEPIHDMDNDQFTLCTVARITPEKGIQLIPEICRILIDRGHSFHWYVIGDGASASEIKIRIDYEKVNEYITLLGEKNNPYPYMKKCSLYIQPSFSEGFCTTTNEAKLLCKPIVTTNVSGMAEQFVHGVTGYIVNSTNVELLADGIEYMMTHPEEMLNMQQNLGKTIENNTHELEKLYCKI